MLYHNPIIYIQIYIILYHVYIYSTFTHKGSSKRTYHHHTKITSKTFQILDDQIKCKSTPAPSFVKKDINI